MLILEKAENNILYIKNADIINGTPLHDIKPFVPEFDTTGNVKIGWFEGSRHKTSNHKSDRRFDFYF